MGIFTHKKDPSKSGKMKKSEIGDLIPEEVANEFDSVIVYREVDFDILKQAANKLQKLHYEKRYRPSLYREEEVLWSYISYRYCPHLYSRKRR
jgi:hypothetical protein